MQNKNEEPCTEVQKGISHFLQIDSFVLQILLPMSTDQRPQQRRLRE